jgi:hypothetical protein
MKCLLLMAALLLGSCAMQPTSPPAFEAPLEPSPAASPGAEPSPAPPPSPVPEEPSPPEPSPYTKASPTPDEPLPPHFPPEVSHYIHPLDETIPPFSAEECTLGGVRIGETKVSELAEVLGIEESEFTIDVIYSLPDDPNAVVLETDYIYGNVTFCFFKKLEGYENTLDFISITGDVPWETPRDIQIGDTFESVLLKFPREKQYSEDENGYFFGYWNSFMTNTPAGEVSASEDSEGDIHLSIRITTAGWRDECLYIPFRDGVVSAIHFGFPWN